MIDGEALKERFRRGSGMLGLSSVLAIIDAQMEAAPSPALTREALAAALDRTFPEQRDGKAPHEYADLLLMNLGGTPPPAGLFRGTVFDAGGGEVRILVDRDTPFYPDRGDRLTFLSETPTPTSTRDTGD